MRLALLALFAVLAPPADALIVGGGGSKSTDCLLVFDAPANTPADRPRDVQCADGDPCDADGTVNGSCQFAIVVCANSTALAGCTLAGVQAATVDHAADNGDSRFDPDFQALQTRIDNTIDPPSSDTDRCTSASNIRVPVIGPLAGNVCKRARKTVKIVTLSTPIAGKAYKDSDRLKLTCEPAAAGCSPTAFFTGTFDRIQRQIFDQRCAISACHDSQSQQAGLILESGAALGNLIDVPATTLAVPADWRRVLPGDSARSFLVAKITGSLAAGQGAQMPLTGPSLDAHLIDVIRLWVDAGAPDTGWVPGTED